MSSLVGNGVYEISGELCLIIHIDMIKAFELCLKTTFLNSTSWRME